MLHNSDFTKQNGEKDRHERNQLKALHLRSARHPGIDTSDYSFPYVASWASGKEMKELKIRWIRFD